MHSLVVYTGARPAKPQFTMLCEGLVHILGTGTLPLRTEKSDNSGTEWADAH